MNSFLKIFLLLVLHLGLGGCGSKPSPTSVPYLPGTRGEGNPLGQGRTEEETSLVMKKDTVSVWEGDGVFGAPSVVISLSHQRAYFYKGQTLVGISQVSTGTAEHATPTGDFKVSQKSKDHESNLYGEYKTPDGRIIQKEVDVTKHPKPPGAIYDGADMPFFMRFNGGIGMHGGILPGYAASHGCIRMPYPMAKIFYANVRHGTPVRVVR